MTKKLLFRALALMLAVGMMFTAVACNGSKDDSSDDTTVSSSDVDTSSEENTSSGEESKDTSSTQSNTSSQNKPAQNTSSQNKLPPSTIDNSKPKTSLTRDQVMAKMPASLKGTTVKYAYWWNPKEQMEKEAIEAFEKKTGIKLEPVVMSYGGFYTQLAAKVAAGDSPDVVRLMDNGVSNASYLQPITNSGFDFNDTAWDSVVMGDFTWNGHCYATNLRDSAVMDYAVIYYNKRALKAAEMEDPYTIWKNTPDKWTWTKFWKMCAEFVAANKKSSDTYYGATFEYPDAYPRALGGAIYQYNASKGKYEVTITSNAMKVGWQRTADAVAKKWLIKKHDVSLFESGKILFFWSGPYSVRIRDERQEELKATNDLGIVPLPTDSKVQTLYEYTSFGIVKGAKNAAAVPYYLRWVLDQKSYDMNKVWVTPEAREVMKYVGAQEKLFHNACWYEAFFNDIYNGGANQVQTVLDSHKNSFAMTVNKLNEQIKLY